MDPAGRTGPRTGALDVGAQAGTTVYAPVTGMITAIRPDPMVQGANVVEIKPDGNANVRVTRLARAAATRPTPASRPASPPG